MGGLILVLSTFIMVVLSGWRLGCRWKCHGSSAMSSSTDGSRCLSDTPSARTAFSHVWRKGDTSGQPEHVPPILFLSDAHYILHRYPSGTGIDQTRSLGNLTNALSHSSCLPGTGVWVPRHSFSNESGRAPSPALFRNCATSTLTGATPTPVEAFHVKAQIRCLGGTAATQDRV